MAGRPAPPPLGPYQYHEVLSALRKTVKLGLVEDAIYWLNVLLEKGGSAAPKTAATQLWIMAAEDIDDPPIVTRAFAVYQMIAKVGETDHLYFLTAAMCRARKWWEHEEGLEVDLAWAKAIGDLSDESRQRPVPVYALDRHTRAGWARFRGGLGMDDRFSGTELGRAKTVYLFLRDGELDPHLHLDEGFWAHWQERKRLQNMADGEMNEPRSPEDAARVPRPNPSNVRSIDPEQPPALFEEGGVSE